MTKNQKVTNIDAYLRRGASQQASTSSPTPIVEQLKQTRLENITYQDLMDSFAEMEQFLYIQPEDQSINKLTISSQNNHMVLGTSEHNRGKTGIGGISDRALLWTMVGGVVATLALIVSIYGLNIVATQSIREETVAKAGAILTEIKASNQEVLHEVQGIRSDMQNLRHELDQQLEMQEIKTENKMMKDRLDTRRNH